MTKQSLFVVLALGLIAAAADTPVLVQDGSDLFTVATYFGLFALYYVIISCLGYFFANRIEHYDPFNTTNLFRRQIVPGIITSIAILGFSAARAYFSSPLDFKRFLFVRWENLTGFFMRPAVHSTLKIHLLGRALDDALLTFFLMSLMLYLLTRFLRFIPCTGAEWISIIVAAIPLVVKAMAVMLYVTAPVLSFSTEDLAWRFGIKLTINMVYGWLFMYRGFYAALVARVVAVLI